MENYFEKEQYINPSLADADGLLSRYETFNLFMDIADDHAGSMGVAWRDISPRDLFWLTVKTKIVFEERPKLGDTVTLATWVEEPTRLRGDRNYEMRMGGKVLVRGRTDWAVLNTKTMKLVPIDDVYPEGLDYSRPSACPEGFTRIRDRFDASDRYAEYTVRSTDIDVGHHMTTRNTYKRCSARSRMKNCARCVRSRSTSSSATLSTRAMYWLSTNSPPRPVLTSGSPGSRTT